MTRVILGGSRRIARLDEEVRRRLDRIVEQQFQVVVGDANGADKAFQKYLAERRYENVEVFCSGRTCRNNVGGWESHHSTPKARPGTFEYYAAKDQAMAAAATVGFMLWDGESVGTMLNVWRLMRQRKSCLVYVQPQKRFHQVRSEEEWKSLLELATAEIRGDVERRIKSEMTVGSKVELPLFGPDLHSVGLA